jgi:glycosyltransferase involved in cell wall biosynthesis
MKISFIIPHANLSGGARVVAIYAERLHRRGHDVTIISTPGYRRDIRSRLGHLIRWRQWLRSPSPDWTHFEGTGVRIQTVERWRPIVDRDVPDGDVVIATWWETAEWVAALAPRKGAKAYFIQHHEVFPYLPTDRVEATWRLPLHKITVAQWLSDLARDRYGDEHTSLVPNSVNLEQFHAPHRGRQCVPTVGLVYSAVAFKGCDLSLRAFALASEQLPGLGLVAFGDVPIFRGLPLPPSSEYHQNPKQNVIKDIYSKCDAWLFGSRSEGFGLPILEAMACRTPVIGVPAGAAPELLEGGGGILIPHHDPNHMAQAIVRIATMPDAEWTAMSEAAYLTARRYTWDDAAERFESALVVAIGRATRGDVAGAGRSDPASDPAISVRRTSR